jgi:cytidylate kinase
MSEKAPTRQGKVIAIDGPAAAGKTVVGRAVARRLGYTFLDTGIMYRALTWLALRQGLAMDDEPALGHLAYSSPMRPTGKEGDGVELQDRELVQELRSPEVDRNVSLVSRVSEVRRALVDQQRQLAAAGGMVMVGRDIGTVVLPGADLKLFMSAPVEARAKRRWQEMRELGHEVELDQVLQETRARDETDSQRGDSPLVAAPDSISVDTGHLSVDQVVEKVLEKVYQQFEWSGP